MSVRNTLAGVAVLATIVTTGCNLPRNASAQETSPNPGGTANNPTEVQPLPYQFPIVTLENGEMTDLSEYEEIQRIFNQAVSSTHCSRFADITASRITAQTYRRETQMSFNISGMPELIYPVRIYGNIEYNNQEKMSQNSFEIESFDPKTKTLVVKMNFDGDLTKIEEKSLVLFELAQHLKILEVLIDTGVSNVTLVETYKQFIKYLEQTNNDYGMPLITEISARTFFESCTTARITGYESWWINQSFCAFAENIWGDEPYSTNSEKYNTWLNFFYSWYSRITSMYSGVTMGSNLNSATPNGGFSLPASNNFHNRVFEEMSDPKSLPHRTDFIANRVEPS